MKAFHKNFVVAISICLLPLMSLQANSDVPKNLSKGPLLIAASNLKSSPQALEETPHSTTIPYQDSIEVDSKSATEFESPDYLALPYSVVEISENSFCLTEKLIQSRVELRLLQHGITPNLGTIRKDYPHLKIGLKVDSDSFTLHLDLSRLSTHKTQEASYQKNNIVWKEKVIGIHQHDLEVIFDSLDYLLANFLSKYISANQSILHQQ